MRKDCCFLCPRVKTSYYRLYNPGLFKSFHFEIHARFILYSFYFLWLKSTTLFIVLSIDPMIGCGSPIETLPSAPC